MDTFTVTGNVNGERVTITWEDGAFRVGVGYTDALQLRKAQVELSPTGPFFQAASKPADVALLTALAVFDPVHADVEMDAAAEAIMVALSDEYALPEDAVG